MRFLISGSLDSEQALLLLVSSVTLLHKLPPYIFPFSGPVISPLTDDPVCTTLGLKLKFHLVFSPSAPLSHLPAERAWTKLAN
jgi:hypothetical protein